MILKTVFNDQELVDKIAGEMQRTVLMDSESIIRRVISGLIQEDEADVKNDIYVVRFLTLSGFSSAADRVINRCY